MANLHNPFKFEIYYIKSLSKLKYIFKVRNLFKISEYFRWIIYFTFFTRLWRKKTDDDLLQMSSPIQLQRLFYWSPINNRYTPHTWIFFSGKSKSGMKKMSDKRRKKKLQKVGYFCWFSFPNAYFALMVIQYIPLKTFFNHVLVFFYSV